MRLRDCERLPSELISQFLVDVYRVTDVCLYEWTRIDSKRLEFETLDECIVSEVLSAASIMYPVYCMRRL